LMLKALTMPKSNTLSESLVNHTGISFRKLASFLEVSHTLLLLHKSGARTLPANALLQLALAQKSVEAHTVQGAKKIKTFAVTKTADLSTQAFMKKEAQWCIARCHPLQKKLAEMQQKFQQASATLHLLAVLSADPQNQTVKKKRWIKEQGYQAEQKIKTNNWLSQKKIAIAISLLRYEASLWEKA